MARRRPSSALLQLVLAAAALAAQEPAARLVDRVVAVVDEDPILLSDVERVIGLRVVEAQAGESPEALRRRVLDGLIEQRLRLHEIGRFGFEQTPLEEVDRQVEQIAARFPDEAAWRAELARLGLGESDLRQIVARQLSVLAYVEERLGARVFVGVEDVRRYYEEELLPELERRGEPPPPIDQVREQIRGLLRERRLNEEIVRWTAELRAAADVVDLFDAPERPLPPEIGSLPPGR